ncbi:hypothetical protein [Enterococcus sp. LJL51]|uniref:hypothetical protein n=1 Tax=Enterococcus sp. LJL51 TaxID=3416656 RepID=UPI003CEFAF30
MKNADNPIYLYQLLTFRNSELYMIECIDEKDFYINENKKILLFKTIELLKKYSIEKNIELTVEDLAEEKIDLDMLRNWLDTTSTSINSVEFLILWNFFDDVAFSIGSVFLGSEDRYSSCYSKLFHGNNLPAINTSGKKYTPEWDKEELEKIRQVMNSGMEIFEESATYY